MAIHFSDLGFDLDEYDFLDELSQFVDDNMDHAVSYERNGRSCLCVTVDGTVELWFPVVDGDILYEGVQPHYRTGSLITANAPSLMDMDENGMSGMLKVLHGEDYPMNLNVPCADLLTVPEDGAPLTLEVACFAESMDLYEDEADFEENCAYGEGFQAKSFIPTGCYSEFGNDSVAETPRAMMTGVIAKAEKLTNSYTGNDYYRLVLDTQGGSFTVLAAEELCYDEPAAGNVVMGKFWFSGTVLK